MRLSYTLITFICLILITTTAYSSEYLVDVYLQNKKLGLFFLYEIDNTLYAEQRLFNELGFPVQSDEKLDKLRDIAKVAFDRSKQTLHIEFTDTTFFSKDRRQTESVVLYHDTTPPLFDWKSIDYSFNYTLNSRDYFSYYLRATGNVRDYDWDLYLYPRKSVVSMEKYSNGVNIKLGYIPERNFHGFLFSNEHQTYEQFSTEYVQFDIPLQSILDVFRNNEYLYTTVYQGGYLELPLMYGENNFKIVARTTDAKVLTFHLSRSVYSLLLPPGQVKYTASAGFDDEGKLKYYGRFGLGVSDQASMYSTVTDKERKLSLLLSITGLKTVLDVSANFNETYKQGISLSVISQHLNVLYDLYRKREFVNAFLFIPVHPFYITLSHYDSKQRDIHSHVTTDKVTVFTNYKNLYISSYVGLKSDNTGKYTIYGIRGTCNINSTKLSAEYSAEHIKTGKDKSTLQFLVSQYLDSFGELRISQSYDKYTYESLKLTTTKAQINITKLSLANIYVSIEYNHRMHEWVFQAGIQGSFTKQGFTNQHLAGNSIVCFIPYIDRNFNKTKDADEDTLDVDIEVKNYKTVRASKYYTPCLELTNTEPVVVTFHDFFDASPAHRTVSVLPQRGRVVNVYMPYVEFEELEGNLGRDGVVVLAVNKITGERIARATTRLGGWYLLRIQKNLIKQIDIITSSKSYPRE